ncbi:hypothetical protein GBK02_14910 [Dechloromonas sp. TW-R-39-2]|uniref:hypothetical protein n=1 Tax=Dechloromonas sp. TW-R-39-2 TaxID=2654218 RepID=UPI00193D33FD|nr:hypothetical protein [Dechloromonas sp. TW-R-39-2]QRM20581.1 hypothetical protein GBK02_14910 [Dechloromonas sp. TW-R-39-2]
MNKPMIQPESGQVICITSIWADYCKGLVSAECVSWAYLVGLNVFGEIHEASDLTLYEAVYSDTDGYKEEFGCESGLNDYLSRDVYEFQFWWAAHSRLDEPTELYDACYSLADKHQSPSDFILERVSEWRIKKTLAIL